MVLNGQVRRACIYFIYDRDGVIDDYIIYQLQDMRKNVEFLHCVINGRLTSDGRKALEKVADEVYVRENKGMDIGAYKAALEHIGWDEIKKFDELVLMNYTCFGPVYPFKEVFYWAEKQDVDFWGLTWGSKCNWWGTNNYTHYNKSKRHIQSYFIAMRTSLCENNFLQNFFSDIPNEANYVMSVYEYEYAFPGYFEKYGYKGMVYCDEKDDLNYPLLHNPVHLLKDYRMPLFKKRSFFHHYTDVIANTAGEETRRLIDFIETETDYDMNMVWDSILRTQSLSDIVRCMQLNRIVPRNYTVNKVNSSTTVGIVFHAYYADLFDEDIEYILNFPKETGVLITTNTQEKKSLLEEKLKSRGREGEVIVIENRGRDVSSLVVGASDFVFKYDLICFAHEKKTLQVSPQNIGSSWAYKLNECVFATADYVLNVINLFDSEPRLGIAFPSAPNHGPYSMNIGTGWTGNYNNAKKLLDKFGINPKINEHTLCVAPLGTCFWFRPKALAKLFKGIDGKGWKYSDFPSEPNRYDETILHAIERVYAYFAQDAGYYPVYLYNDKFAEIELTNLEFNKSGSADMRMWVERLANKAINYGGDIASDNLIENTIYYEDQNVNYGVKRSMVHLATALRYKFPRLWKLMLPFRRLGQKILGIKTK